MLPMRARDLHEIRLLRNVSLSSITISLLKSKSVPAPSTDLWRLCRSCCSSSSGRLFYHPNRNSGRFPHKFVG